MGTRHLQIVISKSGKDKIRQYGQWDGYPSGQGIEILKFLKRRDLTKYQEELEKVEEITEQQCKEVDSDKDWIKNYPHLSRDCGSNIHELIEQGKVKFIQHMDDEEANQWCEGFYTIDFKKNEFTSLFYGEKKTYSLDKLPTVKRYLKEMEPKQEE